jgi:hypothetical protein
MPTDQDLRQTLLDALDTFRTNVWYGWCREEDMDADFRKLRAALDAFTDAPGEPSHAH